MKITFSKSLEFLRQFLHPRYHAPKEHTVSAKHWSLRQRLLLAVMGISISLWLISLVIIICVAWFATSEVFDEALEEGAYLVLQLGSQKQDNSDLHHGDLTKNRDDTLKLRMYYQLVAPDGQVLLRGKGTPETAFLSNFHSRKGFATVFTENEFWRVYVYQGQDGIAAQVAQPMEERLDLLEDMAENLAWPTLGLLGLLGVSCWLMIHHLIKPLEELAARIAAKSPADLSPVETQQNPQELQPILSAINTLLLRLETALENERRFTADAAHELRTPLSALRMRTQLIERELSLPALQLQQLRTDVDRCTALIENLLALARLDAQPLERETVDLSRLFNTLDMSAAKDREMCIEHVFAVSHLRASPTLLATALRNLIENAVRYGNKNGHIRIESSTLSGGGVRLAVRDDGPGVPITERVNLGRRFFRILGTGQSGCGLGLSIVIRIATLHGAKLHFEDGLEGQGLGVVLDFPAR